MRTIEISDELYEKLERISKEMNTQDHLCTRMPYYWTIREYKKVWGSEDSNDGWELIDDECSEGTGLTDDSKKAKFYEYLRDNELSDEWKVYRKEHSWEIGMYGVQEVIADFLCEEHDHRKWYYQNIEIYHNSFLTLKACQDHIKQNNYHYTDPMPYLFHANRNPDMESVQQFLCELTGGKLHT